MYLVPVRWSQSVCINNIILKVHAGNLDKKGEKNKSFKNIYIFGFRRPC